MLCFRCGSYNTDEVRVCAVCSQVFSERRRRSSHRGIERRVPGIPEPPFEPRTTFAGRYRILNTVSYGASGWVMRGRDTEVDVDVSLKFISTNLLQAPKERALFLKWVSRAKKISHPNLVRIYDEGEVEGQVYYTMPYLEGLTLRKIIDLRVARDEIFDAQEVLPIVGQLASGLQDLGKFSCHGALAPKNVVVLPDVLKITGLPHLAGLPRRPFVVQQGKRESILYLAPEARREGGETDARSDVYSLAVIASEMLVGLILERDPERFDGKATRLLDAEIYATLRRGLSEQPKDRFAKPIEFFDALADASGGLKLNQPLTPAILSDDSTTSVDAMSVKAPEPAVPQSFSDTRLGTERRGGKKKAAKKKRAVIWPWILLVLLMIGLGFGGASWWRMRPLEPIVLEATPAEIPGFDETDEAVTGEAEDEPDAMDEGAVDQELEAGVPEDPGTVDEPPRQDDKAGIKVNPTGRDREVPKAADKRAADTLTKLKKGLKTPTEPPAQVLLPPPPLPAEVPAEKSATPEPLVEKPVVADPKRVCPPGMVAVAGGSVLVGSQPSDPMRGFGDKNAHKERVRAYCVDIHEYPNQSGRRPTVNVSWAKAKQLCESQGKRLCTENEWEHACAGNSGLRFPYGNTYKANACRVGDGAKMANAGSKSSCRSPYGVFDMSGNAAEWTSSRWSSDISDRVLKGGSAGQASFAARCAARANETPSTQEGSIGFRCCKAQD